MKAQERAVPENLFPDKSYFREMRRPWKLATFALGMSWLLYGAVNFGISDWDIGISLLMGGLTYVCAPWSTRTILHAVRHRPGHWLLWVGGAFAVAWFVVDGDYYIYHTIAGNQMFRRENLFASSALYFLAGFIWLYRGSLEDFITTCSSLTVMHPSRVETLKSFSGTFIGCGAMLLVSLPEHLGSSIILFLFYLVPHSLYSSYKIVRNKDERKVRLIKMAVWSACIIIIVSTHYIRHLQTRNAADQIVREILLYKESQKAFPANVDVLNSGVRRLAGKYHIKYYLNYNNVYLYYPVTFTAFDTYKYDFAASVWRYQRD